MKPAISATRALRWGGFTLALLIIGFGGLSSAIQIQIAVVSLGRLALGDATHWVQHPVGGQVLSVAVTSGQRVARGDSLVVLDGRKFEESRINAAEQIVALAAQRARYVALRDDLSALKFEPVKTAKGALEIPSDLQASQRAILSATRKSWAKQNAQMKQRQTALRRRVEASLLQQSALSERLELLTLDLDHQEQLVLKGIAPFARLAPLKHQIAELKGDRAALVSERAMLEGQILEIDLDLARQTASRQAEVLSEIERTTQEIDALRNNLLDIALRQAALELQAPFEGHVHDLRVETAGTVLRAAEPAMAIDPIGTGRRIVALVAPKDVDHLFMGQKARVHLDGHGVDIWQEGRLDRVSPDVLFDVATRESYFEVEIVLDETPSAFSEIARLGMPVTVYFATKPRSILSYLLSPFAEYARKAFREA
jgi:HlyD family type I secretion membrane fusion protein